MGKKVLIICEETGCSSKVIEKAIELNNEGQLSELYCLRVINHPPLQWCEHGGADNDKAEHALDLENRKKREAWVVNEEAVHGEAVKKVVEKLNDGGVENVKVKFIEKEIAFGNTLINEMKDGSYDTVIMTEKSWDHINEKKVPHEIEVITVSGPIGTCA